MEEGLTFRKTIHYLIEQFVIAVESSIECQEHNACLIFYEIIRRRVEIAKQIGKVAYDMHMALKFSDETVSENVVQDKLHILVDNMLREDVLDLASSLDDTEGYDLSYEELIDHVHIVLFCETMAQVSSPFPYDWEEFSSIISLEESHGYEELQTYTTLRSQKDSSSHLEDFSSSFVSLESDEYTRQQSYETSWADSCSNLSYSVKELSCEDSSLAETETSASLYDIELVDSLQTLEMPTPSPECSMLFENHVLSDEMLLLTVIPMTENVEDACLSSNEADKQIISLISDSSSIEDTLNITHTTCESFINWECLYGESILDCDYTFGMENDDSTSLVDSSDSCLIPRSFLEFSDILIYDVLNLLIGIPSSTFYYDTDGKFKIRSGVNMSCLSSECMENFMEDFLKSGSTFHMLEVFCNGFKEGLIMKGMCSGIKCILSVYAEYIYSFKTHQLKLSQLKSKIEREMKLINTLGEICGFYAKRNHFKLPKGLGLLKHLLMVVWDYRTEENSVMIAVLLKHAFYPFFSYLNTWITEGICYDPFDEFQIQESRQFLHYEDRCYWQYAYTEIDYNDMRTIPKELESFAYDILNCGKTIRLLKKCSPKHPILGFIRRNPPPQLSFVFSYPASMSKAKECIEYVKGNSESVSFTETNCDYKNHNSSHTTFIKELASLLPSGNVDEISLCIQHCSLLTLMLHNVDAVLRQRICLTEKIVVDYFIKELKLLDLLSGLRDVYFLHDAGFNRSICRQLFAMKNQQFTAERLTEIVSDSLAESYQALPSSFKYMCGYLFLPDRNSDTMRVIFPHKIYIDFEADWPHNIIINDISITDYNVIFTRLLEIEYLCWLLSKVWRSLILDKAKLLSLQNSPQYKEILLMRFNMESFIKIIQCSIYNQLQGPLWKDFVGNIQAGGLSIDKLLKFHHQYLKNALARCFCTKKTKLLYEAVTNIFNAVHMFCKCLVYYSSWKFDPVAKHYKIMEYCELMLRFKDFETYKALFYREITKEVATKRFLDYLKDASFSVFLEHLCEMFRL